MLDLYVIAFVTKGLSHLMIVYMYGALTDYYYYFHYNVAGTK